MSLRATVRPSSAAGPNFAAIWHMPGQTVRQSGTCQANFAAIWREPGQTLRLSGTCQATPASAATSLLRSPSSRTDAWGVPQRLGSSQRIATTVRPSGACQAKLCGHLAHARPNFAATMPNFAATMPKLCGYPAKAGPKRLQEVEPKVCISIPCGCCGSYAIAPLSRKPAF